MKCLVLALTILALAACGKSSNSSGSGVGKSTFSVWTKTTGTETINFVGKSPGFIGNNPQNLGTIQSGCGYTETFSGSADVLMRQITINQGAGCTPYATELYTNDGTTLTRCFESSPNVWVACETFR